MTEFVVHFYFSPIVTIRNKLGHTLHLTEDLGRVNFIRATPIKGLQITQTK